MLYYILGPRTQVGEGEGGRGKGGGLGDREPWYTLVVFCFS